MKTVTTFDSLGCAKRLASAGVPREQAEAQGDSLRDVMEGQLAVKRDVREMEDRLTYRLTLWLGGIVVASSTSLLAVLPLIIRK